MPSTGNDTPSINAHFAMAIINRAAEIVAGAATTPGQNGNAFDALRQARDEFKAGETRQREKSRSYGWALLMRDVGQYIIIRHPLYRDSFTPIVDWSEATAPDMVAQTLREAATTIADLVAERTRAASKFEAMTPQEMAEYDLMWKAAAFLTRQGLTVNVAWDRENPNDSIDYRATVDGVEWAFELTELRIDAEGSHFTIGRPAERRSIREQRDQLVTKVPQIPDGPDALQQALDNSAQHGSKPSKTYGSERGQVLPDTAQPAIPVCAGLGENRHSRPQRIRRGFGPASGKFSTGANVAGSSERLYQAHAKPERQRLGRHRRVQKLQPGAPNRCRTGQIRLATD